jgi:hypothetical protein
LESSVIKVTLDKLKSHPLVEKSARDDSWDFRQNQVRVLLLAQQIIEWKRDDIERFLGRARLDPESLQDLGAMVVDMIAKDTAEDEVANQLHRIVRATSPSFSAGSRHAVADDGSRLAGVISLTAVEKLHPKQGNSTRRERYETLLRLCGPESIRGVSFSGTIARYDFTGARFDRCRFERVSWANCKFDGDTVFADCQFIGGIPPAYCEAFGSAQALRSYFDDEAQAMFNSIKIREGMRTYSLDDLRADMDSVLRKFVFKGGQGLKTVSSASLVKGTISASPHRDDVIEVLTRGVLDDHLISGSSAGYHIAESATEALKFYAANNVFSGPLRDAFERLRLRLGLD